LLLSPTKQVARGSAAYLSDADILRNLDSILDDTPPHSGAEKSPMTPGPAPSAAKSKSVAASGRRTGAGKGKAAKRENAAKTPAAHSPMDRSLASEIKQVQVRPRILTSLAELTRKFVHEFAKSGFMSQKPL
jgi:hypothetical protein